MRIAKIEIPGVSIPTNPLPFGGVSPLGEELGINSRYFTKNNKPWYPIMGEIHYSRYPVQYWEESLLKMAAGGIEIAASYVFWIHHEEEKGKWDFSGRRNLRRFVELCDKLNLKFFLRFGPWAHGECRNGGFPDWLQFDKSIRLRENDPKYFDAVRPFYQKIYDETKGLFLKDGGPIIGIQIENEHGHCGGVGGEEGIIHMKTLKDMALDIGFDAPFYTATGWGGGNVVDGEMLPVQGGYVDAPWDQHTNPLPASQVFLLEPFRNDPIIGSDWGTEFEDFTYSVEEYPYLTAELGGGLQVTKLRRPIVSAIDTAAQTVCKLASGANLLGYYMYHGGTNPEGKLSTLQETKETGSWTDVPVLSYDFQACIGEYGELHQSYRKLKKLHMFLRDFGDLVAPMMPVFPPNRVENPEDTETLRFCVRTDGSSGFLFINNHQRNRNMATHEDVVISIESAGENIEFPKMNINPGFYGIFPYNLNLDGKLLKSANAQLLCKLGDHFVFFCHEKPLFNFENESAKIIVLTEEESDNAWVFDDKLLITEGGLIKRGENIILTTCNLEETVIFYPEKDTVVYSFNPINLDCSFFESEKNDEFAEYKLEYNFELQEDVSDIFLSIDFIGDRAELYRDGAMVADWYTTGLPWRVGLRRFDFEGVFTLKVYPVTQDTYFECDVPKTYSLENISLEAQYFTNIRRSCL